MKRPGFFHGVLVAALFALAGSAFVAAFVPFLGTVSVARLVIPGLALAYLLYLLPHSRERAGRVTVIALWSAMAIAAWLFVPSFVFYLLIHTGALWLVRSLYFYSGLVPALMDIALNGFSIVVTLSTFHRTGSVFLAIWVFFLVQALFVVIPATIRRNPVPNAAACTDEFDRSRRQAEVALNQLIRR